MPPKRREGAVELGEAPRRTELDQRAGERRGAPLLEEAGEARRLPRGARHKDPYAAKRRPRARRGEEATRRRLADDEYRGGRDFPRPREPGDFPERARDDPLARGAAVLHDRRREAGLFPALRNRATISSRFRTPINTTNVESALRTRSQSTPPTPLSASWPVRMVNEELSPRKVSGIPAAEGTASAAETPGTISQGIPARARYRASSAPRPNSIGSPP